MVNEADARASASIKPSQRSAQDNKNLQGNLSQATRNKMHEAARQERIHGPK